MDGGIERKGLKFMDQGGKKILTVDQRKYD